ncbi:MAG: DUF1587 domain-containing protein [Planctomycetota bacterium]
MRRTLILGWILTGLLSPLSSEARAEDPPTLNDLKASGAKRSRYTNRKAPPTKGAVEKHSPDRFREALFPILEAHCVKCHGPDKAKADLRIDKLDPDLVKGGDVDWWLEVMSVLGNGEMPPPKRSKLSSEDRGKAIDLLSKEVRLASIVRRASGGHSSFRRMTRYEYNYALQDLLGLEREFSRDLPPEARSEDGFLNSSETLQMSVSQLETYRRLARTALTRATALGSQPAPFYWGVSMKRAGRIDWEKQGKELSKLEKKFKDDPEKLKRALERFQRPHGDTYFKNLADGRTVSQSWSYGRATYALKPAESRPKVPDSFDHVAVIPHGRRRSLIVELGEKLPDEGILRVRVLASRADDNGEVPSLQLHFGWQASNEGRARLKVSRADHPITASSTKPEFYEWDVPLGDIYPRNTVRKTSPLGAMPNPSEYIRTPSTYHKKMNNGPLSQL